MPFDFGDIVLVPFPFTSHTASKKRPAVVVSNRAYSIARPDVIVMAVTSQLHPLPGAGEISIAQWRTAGLLKPSTIKPVFATLEQTWCCGGSVRWMSATRLHCERVSPIFWGSKGFDALSRPGTYCAGRRDPPGPTRPG
jgi:mRNA interferase MazF